MVKSAFGTACARFKSMDHREKTVAILVAHHKPFPYPSCSWLRPIAIEALVNAIPPGQEMLRDDAGDNIHGKIPSYNELGALYWLWKNDHSDVVGLYHYRRYLSLVPISNFQQEAKWRNVFDFLVSPEQRLKILDALETSDFIVPRPIFFSKSSREQYLETQPLEPWLVFENVVKRRCSELYKYWGSTGVIST